MRITKLGEEILRKKAEPVLPEEINDELRSFINEMFDSMIQANGVGLAGPQAGISKRLFVVIADDDIRRVFINPQIISTSSNMTDYEEGCLSIPGVNALKKLRFRLLMKKVSLLHLKQTDFLPELFSTKMIISMDFCL